MYFIPERWRWAFQDSPCAVCSKCKQPTGVIECCGCKQVFCSNDNKDHRAELQRRLQTFKQQYTGWHESWKKDQANQAQTLRNEQGDLWEEIRNWEEKSIAAVKREAHEARQKIQKLYEDRLKAPDECVSRSRWLMQKIAQAEKVDDFHELHLERWTAALDCLRRSVEGWITSFDRIEYTEPFIKKLIVREIDVSSSVQEFRNFDAMNDRSVVISRSEYGSALPNDRPEFHAGVYRFYFKAKHFSFGITSKHFARGTKSDALDIQYGWTADNRVYIDGTATRNHAGCITTTELADSFMLEVDCERHFLHLRNQQTGQTRQIVIDTQRCPLPWQLVVHSSNNHYRRSLQDL